MMRVAGEWEKIDGSTETSGEFAVAAREVVGEVTKTKRVLGEVEGDDATLEEGLYRVVGKIFKPDGAGAYDFDGSSFDTQSHVFSVSQPGLNGLTLIPTLTPSDKDRIDPAEATDYELSLSVANFSDEAFTFKLEIQLYKLVGSDWTPVMEALHTSEEFTVEPNGDGETGIATKSIDGDMMLEEGQYRVVGRILTGGEEFSTISHTFWVVADGEEI